MSAVSQLLAFGGVWALIVVTPGPDFVVTARWALTASRRTALAAVAGIALGTAAWASAAATGMALLLAHSAPLIDAVRWAGAAYLLWLAWHSVRHAGHPLPTPTTSQDAAPATPAPAPAPAPASGHPALRAWRTGLLADLGNPKAAIFWCSLFATVFPTAAPPWELGVAVVLAVMIAAAWYTAVAVLFTIPSVLRAYARVKRRVDLATGAILSALAIRIATGD